jgi:hypothetical protein
MSISCSSAGADKKWPAGLSAKHQSAVIVIIDRRRRIRVSAKPFDAKVALAARVNVFVWWVRKILNAWIETVDLSRRAVTIVIGELYKPSWVVLQPFYWRSGGSASCRLK